MEEVLRTLKTRRSVKKFTDEQITGQELLEVLSCGINSPSARNKQSCIFIVVQEPKWINRLSILNAEIMGAKDGFDPFYGAPTVIFVLANKNANHPVEDGSLCIGNMLNGAYAQGLGARWINRIRETFEVDLGRELLEQSGYEGEYIGIGACILGYPENGFPEQIQHKSDYYKIIK